ncbi:hypothetical protein [Devosia sp. DBB001]|nr:hypothetical protein [Devosia sp. DBB001]
MICRQDVEHAPLTIGASPVVVLKRERVQLDRANGEKRNCAAFYLNLKADLEAQ